MATTTRPALVKGSRSSRSTITLKLLMAASGLLFIGFVLGHMYGNLKAFAGEETFNNYAEHLREFGEPILPHEGFLWIARVGLLAALVVHVTCAVILARRAGRARTVKYVVKKNTHSSFSSHWMRWGGATLLLFIVWHLLNFSFGKVNVSNGETGDPDKNPYRLMVDNFDVWWLTAIYLVAMVALALHLHHGTFSSAQTLGLTGTARARRNARAAGLVIAIVVAGGFSLVPIGVLAGIID
ncbi:succinate dehydrogenase cytochrome b subunit [Nocardioides rubriscoriae]|uniref:succinate dehydrogenase cytochrome b subunit n=1 Tax=Nocardioides rubriscoriae TaxID=642762 RepID=UPI0011DF8E3E|nr:succinate dehydrogenase cytochrome b subunit [Nocardioides rubriscoriae]